LRAFTAYSNSQAHVTPGQRTSSTSRQLVAASFIFPSTLVQDRERWFGNKFCEIFRRGAD